MQSYNIPLQFHFNIYIPPKPSNSDLMVFRTTKGALMIFEGVVPHFCEGLDDTRVAGVKIICFRKWQCLVFSEGLDDMLVVGM